MNIKQGLRDTYNSSRYVLDSSLVFGTHHCLFKKKKKITKNALVRLPTFWLGLVKIHARISQGLSLLCCLVEPGGLNELGSWITLTTHTSLSPIRRGFAPGFVNYKKGGFNSKPQVKKFTSCLLMFGGSLRVLRLLPPLKLVAMI